MPEIDPITREEKLWSGEDIEPITREEMYIKHIYDKTQTIPSKPITRKEVLLEKAGQGGGGDVTIKQLSVTANGTYSEENTAYSPVIVNVPTPPLSKLTVTENGTYTAPTGTGYDEVAVDVPLPTNAYLLKEVDGLPKDIATFTDGASLPMPSLKVGIEPQQDLHGYDHPWVGGAGKNLLSPFVRTATASGVTYSVATDGKITLIGTATENNSFSLWPTNSGITVKKTGFYTVSMYGAQNARINGEITATQRLNADTAPVSFVVSISSGTTYNESFYIQIEEGETATSYEPYENICPISGHTEANVVVSPTTDAEDGTTYNIQFKDGTNPLTVYGGTLDVVSGELKVVPYYASYNGETLEGEWISDRDVYAVGTIPTIGAQVVNIGATPTTYQLTPTQVKSLLGTNNVWADTGDIEELEYFSKEA